MVLTLTEKFNRTTQAEYTADFFLWGRGEMGILVDCAVALDFWQ